MSWWIGFIFGVVSVFVIGVQRDEEHKLFNQLADVNHKNEQTIQAQQRAFDTLEAACRGHQ